MFKKYQPFAFRALSIYLLEEVFQKNWKRYRKVKGQRGAVLYLTIIVMVILLAIVLGLSAILLSQLKMVKEMENSVIAFYAADTGIEQELKNIYKGTATLPGSSYSYQLDLNGSGNGGFISDCPTNLSDPDDACYKVSIVAPEVGVCNATFSCVKSLGFYKGTQRAIEIAY